MKISATAALILLGTTSTASQNAPVSNQKQHVRKLLMPPPSVIDFSGFNAGDPVTTLDSNTITVSAMVIPSDGAAMVAGQAVIFDTTNPTGGDSDLGTPHKAYAGPGRGIAGKKLWKNDVARGNALIIQTPNKFIPNDNKFGGRLVLDFASPRYIGSIGLLDNDEGTEFLVLTSDGGYSNYINGNGGNNSFENVLIGKPDVTQIIVTFLGSGAITHIDASPPSICYLPLETFSSFSAGDTFTASYATVNAAKTNGPATPMIFDSTNPSGGDLDLGTPHKNFGGPGRGKGGKQNSLFPNSMSRGNVLIFSEDDEPSDPDDEEHGGSIHFEFSSPVDLHSIGLLDNEEGVVFDVQMSDGGYSAFINMNGGNNSFESVQLGKKQVTHLTVTFYGSGAITDINVACPLP